MTCVEETPHQKFSELKGKKFVFAGDYKNNMGHSEMIACAFSGMHCVLCGPKEYKDKMIKETLKKCDEINKKTGGSYEFCDDKLKAAKDADFIYTDVWVSLGEDFSLFGSRIKECGPFQVDKKMLSVAKPTCKFMHCLPAFHDDHTSFAQQIKKEYGDKFPVVKTGAMEVTDEVFQSKANISFREAENRMHTIKAAMLASLAPASSIEK